MKTTRSCLLVAALVAVVILAACSKRSGPPAPGNPVVVDVGGGTVPGLGGASVTVPPGATAAPLNIQVTRDPTAAPALPTAAVSAGSTYEITPHGTTFSKPVTVRLPFDPSRVPAGAIPMIAKAEPGGGWVLHQAEVKDGNALEASFQEFSMFGAVGVDPRFALIVREEPATAPGIAPRNWTPTPSGAGTVYTDTVGSATAVAVSVRSSVGCTGRIVFVVYDLNRGTLFTQDSETFVPGVARTYVLPIYPTYDWIRVGSQIECQEPFQLTAAAPDGVVLSTVGAWPLGILLHPQSLEAHEGQAATFQMVFSSVFDALSTFNVDWLRSDDGGANWRTVGTVSYGSASNAGAPGGHSFLDQPGGLEFVLEQPHLRSADHGAIFLARVCGLMHSYFYYDHGGQAHTADAYRPFCQDSLRATLHIFEALHPPPVIIQQPASAVVDEGDTVSLAVVAGAGLNTGPSTAPLAYQWFRNGIAIAHYDASLTFAPARSSDSGVYSVMVTDIANGTFAFSADALLVVLPPAANAVAPSIVTDPADLTVHAGNPATFAVDATGSAPLAYQWSKGGTAIPGATAAVYTIASVAISDAGLYTVTVSNGVNPPAMSIPATLTVIAAPAPVAPVITTQPASVTVDAGNTATFAVIAGGSAPLSYQWSKDGVPLSGATSPVLTIASATVADAGSYRASVSNGVLPSAVSSAATLTVNPAPQPAAPTITTQPTGLTVLPGATATLAVAATGSAPLVYQWFKGGAPIPGATSAVYLIASATAADAGSYTVTVSNGVGSPVTSSAAVVAVVGAPVIAAQPASTTAAPGQTASFAVGATGTGLAYQWLRDGAAIPGATQPSYTSPAVSPADDGTLFSVVVFNSGGTVVSQPARLTVLPTNALIARAVVAGYQDSFAIDASGALWGWGDAVNLTTGQFEGPGNPALYATRPVQVQGVANVTAFATSGIQYYPSFYALLADGTVSAWGRNAVGQLGDGTLTDRTAPVKVMNGANPIDQVCSIAASNGLLLLVRSEEAGGACGPGMKKRAWVAGLISGSAAAGGLPMAGTAGNGAVLQPVPLLPATTPVKAIWAARDSNVNTAVLFAMEDGATYAWGWSTDNALGAGASTVVVGLTDPVGPVDVSAFWTGVQQVAIGFGFSIGRLSDNTAVAVGRNAEGELGTGVTSTTGRTTLGAVPGLANVSTVSTSYTAAMALSGGALWGWGWGYDYFDGLASPFAVPSPTLIPSIGGFTDLSVGDSHALAIGPGGAVYALGDPSSGALGNGATSGSLVTTPALVTR